MIPVYDFILGVFYFSSRDSKVFRTAKDGYEMRNEERRYLPWTPLCILYIHYIHIYIHYIHIYIHYIHIYIYITRYLLITIYINIYYVFFRPVTRLHVSNTRPEDDHVMVGSYSHVTRLMKCYRYLCLSVAKSRQTQYSNFVHTFIYFFATCFGLSIFTYKTQVLKQNSMP